MKTGTDLFFADTRCPLCGGPDIAGYTRDRFRKYLVCSTCALVFVPEKYHVCREDEKKRYDLHNNHPDDPGYRKFLSRLFHPLCERIPCGAEGLDFGCGPGPALAAMFRESGYLIELYDKFYAPDNSVLEKTYDFIAAAEVAEHLEKPGRELARLMEMLRPGGILGIMTKLVIDREAFDRWHYKNDLTHVCFFSGQTFQWLAGTWQVKVEFMGNDVILLYKDPPLSPF
ncbi:MAG: class I SAM-dependent methyltransferase [Desulfobacterales bacterium]